MTRPLDAPEQAALHRALVLGTRREPAPVPERLRTTEHDAPELTAVAFLSAQRRLTAAPARAAAGLTWVEAPPDPRPLLPDAARPAFRRLVVAARAREAPALLGPVARLLALRGYRLHPFDADVTHPALAACAGPFEAWLAQVSGTAPDVVAALATDETWVQLSPATRAAWLSDRRRKDPAAARALLEAVFAGESADVRARLIDALETGLGPDDVPFLTGLATDRSDKVKRAATALLARAGAALATEALLSDVVATLVVRRTFGLLRPTLALAEGAKAKLDRTAERLERLDPAAVLAALKLPEAKLPALDEAVTPLLPSLGLGAIRHGRTALFAQIYAATRAHVPQAPDTWILALAELPEAQRSAVLAGPLDTDLPQRLAAEPALAELWWRALRDPLPLAASVRLRGAPAWRELLAAVAHPETTVTATASLLRLAPLIPPADAAAAAADLAARGAHAAPLIQQLWRLLAELDVLCPPPVELRSAP